MSLQPGQTLGHYTIAGKIGAGGMGEVWRARDTKLGRDVALKLLPDLFASDKHRMARFQREAQVLASLNHRNIAAIYGLEESDGQPALVLELVEGEDLSQRLKGGPIPPEEALDVARQIAEALEAAHEKGIVHRDLKPANVKLSPDGEVKVLDFGLAKALEGDPGSTEGDPRQSLSPTLTAAATRQGVVLGTAAYMSPEQAKGKTVDRRSDIFAFGIVLFEMLSGRPGFGGETISDTLASIIKDEPDWKRLPEATPPAILILLRRCLEKNPRERLRDIGEARILIQKLERGDTITMAGSIAGFGPEAADEGGLTSSVPAAGSPTRAVRWIAALLLASAAAGFAGWWAGRSAAEPPLPRRLAIDHDELQFGYRKSPLLSPDGSRIGYRAGRKLWVRDLSSLQPREIEAGAGAFFWSHDGRRLAWFLRNELKVVDAAGGQPSVLAKLPSPHFSGGAWAADGTIYLAPISGPLYSLSPLGGEIHVLLEPRAGIESDFHAPSVLPEDRGLLYSVHRKEGLDTIEVLVDGSERRVILRFPSERIEQVVYDPSGYLLFHRRSGQGGLWAVPFSLSTLQTAGEPFLLDPDGSGPSISADGTLLYGIGQFSQLLQLALVDHQGRLVRKIGEPRLQMKNVELSWDGSRAAVAATEKDIPNLWVIDMQDGSASLMTFGEEPVGCAAWHPSGDKIYYCADEGIFSISADGTGTPDLFQEKGEFPSFRPGIPWVGFTRNDGETEDNIYVLRLDGQSDPLPFVVGEKEQWDIQIAPGGEYAVYGSRESGLEEVFVKRFPGGEGRWRVSSTGGGFWPRWGPQGDRIYYLIREGGNIALMKVEVTTSPRLSLSRPEKLFDEDSIPDLRLTRNGDRDYDIHPDGEHILVLFAAEGQESRKARLVLVQNWPEAFGKTAGR